MTLLSLHRKDYYNVTTIMTMNEYTVKDSFSFVKEMVEEDSQFFKGSLDVKSLFTNVLLEETL